MLALSLLNSLTQVANKAGYKIDSAIISSTDVTTKALLAMAQDVVREICEEHPWPKLSRRGSITTVSGTAAYALPDDFSHYHYDTWWNQSKSWRMYGPLSAQEYAEIDGYGISGLVEDAFQIRGMTSSEILIVPTPSASGEVIIFEYLAKRYVRPMTWAQGQNISDSGVYRFHNGNYYVSQGAGTTGATPPTHTSSTASDGGVTWEYYDGAYETFLADTDEPIISAKVLEYGVFERFAEIKELNFEARYKDELDREFGKVMPAQVLRADNQEPRVFQYGQNGRVVFGGR